LLDYTNSRGVPPRVRYEVQLRETWASIFGVQRHYFVSAPATLPIDLLEGMGIVAMREREQKRRVLR
jgi:hypothetical protein